jgi:diguanylate cyclase (GGDEF)-like protein
VDGHPGTRARWPLLSRRGPRVACVTAVLAYDLALIGWQMAVTPLRSGEMVLFIALLACGAACIEATRRLGMPAGSSGDLLSAWWLPVALLLPPVYALIAPVPLNALLQLRVDRMPIGRRVFGAAAAGLSGAAASVTFGHSGMRSGAVRDLASWLSHPGPEDWFTRPLTVLIAIGCAALFSVVRMALMAAAPETPWPPPRWQAVLWDAESLAHGVTGACVGVLITIACVLSPLMLLVALPPVMLLQRSLLHQQLRMAARTDAKTGLLNAAAWRREADMALSRARRTGDSLAVALIDIDHFKQVNDTHGHLTGDQVLARIAAELRQHVRAPGMVGRFGGEEFVVLLPGLGATGAGSVAEDLRERVSATAIALAAGMLRVTVSAGVAVLGEHGDDIPGLLAQADLALYRAKEAGRNRVCMPGARPNAVPPPT